MHKTHLPQGAIIERPGQRVNAIYFPFDCILSLLVVGPEGSRIETGLIGREGMTGSAVADQDSETPYELITQVGGEAFVLPVNDFQRLIDIAPTLEILARRFARVLSIQVSFTALANGRFDIPQHLARWLVMVQDRMPSGNELRLTHDYLAVMLGVRRPSVTEALHILEGERFIRSTRGQIEILSRNGLIQFAGELYGSAEREHSRLMSPPLPNLARLQGMRRTEKVPDRRATGREVSGHG
jgi:CRP-like cAMP-binding protein